ncbi:MAG TPA: hypothetical protein VK420_19820 [Longimicrobium sp.]|nr:hypothetical protein [Longimicrobium sp.]
MMDTRIDQRFSRTWSFFVENAGELLLGSLVVIAGFLVVIPGPWFGLNLLQETLECARTGRRVRWQAAYDRRGNFLKSWGLTFAMGIPILIGYALLIVPGVLLSLVWLHAPVLAAGGRGVVDSLGESYRIFTRRSDWAAYFLNWLVLTMLSALGGITAFAFLLTLPLSVVYLVLCYTDETAPVTIEPPRIQIPV